MPVPSPTSSRAPAPAGRDEAGAAPVVRAEPVSGTLWLATGGAVVAVAVAWAAQRSGASATALGRALGRLDGLAVVPLVAGAAVAQVGVTTRALAGRAGIDGRDLAVRTLRGLLVPWWVLVSLALFLFPTAPGTLYPTDLSTPTWPVVVREWLLLGSLAPGGSRLGTGWVVLTAVVAVALLPWWERALRRSARHPVDAAARAGAALVAVGLGVRVVVVALAPTRWESALATMPPAQLDVLGLGIVVGALVAGARRGEGPLARRGPDEPAPPWAAAGLVAAAVGVLALLAATPLTVAPRGLGSPSVGSSVDVEGIGVALLARVVLLVGAGGLVLAGLVHRGRTGSVATVVGAARTAAWPALMAIPLAAQLWALRAGGVPWTQRLGPLVLATVLGAGAAGLLLGALGRRLFGPRLGRRLTPFSARLAVVTALALAWRLLTLVSINRVNPAGGDPFFYHHQANMLADRVGYSEPFRWVEYGLAVPSAIHPPLMSTWLALGSFAGARTFLAHKALTAVLGVLVVVVAGLIGRRLAGERAGIVVAVLVAVYPNLWVIDGALWPEGIYSAMVGLAVLAAYRWWERPDVGSAALVGLAIALAALTRGEALFLYPILVVPLVLWRKGIGWGDRFRSVLVIGLVGLVLFAPWTIRNQRAFGSLVLLSTNGDEVLYYANCPESYEGPLIGYWSFNCQEAERARTGEPPGNEAQKARYWRRLGIEYARDNTDRIPTVVAARVLRELDLFRPGQNVLLLRIEGRPEMASRVGQWAWWLMAPVGLYGLWVLRRRHVLIWPLVSLGLMVLVTTVYAYGAIRFRTPLEFALLIGAGVAVDHLWRRRARPPSEATP